MPFFTKAKKFLRFQHQNFPKLPRKFRVIAVGISAPLQDILTTHVRQHNADVRYIDSALELTREPRLADVLAVYPLGMGINRTLSQRLKKVRIQLRYEPEGTNDALHVMHLAIQVSTNPGSYHELQERVHRFDEKHGVGAGAASAAKAEEVLNSDLGGAMKLVADSKKAEQKNSVESMKLVAAAAVAAASEQGEVE